MNAVEIVELAGKLLRVGMITAAFVVVGSISWQISNLVDELRELRKTLEKKEG